MTDDRRSIIAYLEERADRIENPPQHGLHQIDRSFGVLLRAIASDIAARMDIQYEEEILE